MYSGKCMAAWAFLGTNIETLLPDCPSLGLDRTLRLMTLHVSATGWTGSRLLGESFHRGYPRSALRWQHASYERHQPHHAHSTGENCQVKRRHMEKHRLHGSARLPRYDQAQ